MNKLARYIIIVAVIAVICFLAWYFSDILTYVLIAAVVSIIGKPLVHAIAKVRIKNKRIPQSLCAAISLLTIWAVFLAFFVLLVPAGINLVNQLSSINMEQFIADMSSALNSFQVWLIANVPGIPSDFSLSQVIVEVLTKMFPNVEIVNVFGSLTNSIISFIWGAFVISFIAFFFLKEEDLFSQAVMMLFPERYEKDASVALNSAITLLTRYFIGIFIEMFCLMTLVTLGLTIFAGLPFKIAIVLGLLSGILNVIPYIGSIASTLIGILIGVLVGVNSLGADFWSMATTMALVYVVAQTIDVAIFQPIIYSKSVRSHPLEIFIVLLVAGSIGGILGMLIAIPSYTVLRVFAKQFFNQFRLVQKLTERM